MHLILQKLDIYVDYDKDKIDELLVKLEKDNIISRMQKDAIDIDRIYEFTKTNIWHEMKSARVIERERPFYINIPAKEVYEDVNGDENILVQGIIDLYYVSKNGEIILVDYKTDMVKDEMNIVNKYKEQLMLYKRALESALDKNVDRVYIYSLYLGKQIQI